MGKAERLLGNKNHLVLESLPLTQPSQCLPSTYSQALTDSDRAGGPEQTPLVVVVVYLDQNEHSEPCAEATWVPLLLGTVPHGADGITQLCSTSGGIYSISRPFV